MLEGRLDRGAVTMVVAVAVAGGAQNVAVMLHGVRWGRLGRRGHVVVVVVAAAVLVAVVVGGIVTDSILGEIVNVDDGLVVLLGVLGDGLLHRRLRLLEVGRGAQDRGSVRHIRLGDEVIHGVAKFFAQHRHGEDDNTRATAGSDETVERVDELAEVMNLIGVGEAEDATVHRDAVSHGDTREIRTEGLGGVAILETEADVRVGGDTASLANAEEFLKAVCGDHVLGKNVAEGDRARGCRLSTLFVWSKHGLAGEVGIFHGGLGTARAERLRGGHHETGRGFRDGARATQWREVAEEASESVVVAAGEAGGTTEPMLSHATEESVRLGRSHGRVERLTIGSDGRSRRSTDASTVRSRREATFEETGELIETHGDRLVGVSPGEVGHGDGAVHGVTIYMGLMDLVEVLLDETRDHVRVGRASRRSWAGSDLARDISDET